MPDMLVKLYRLPSSADLETALRTQGIQIKRALAPDRRRIEEFSRTCADEDYSAEVSVALARTPAACYIATKEKEPVGFACFETTAKNFFGPMAVRKEYRGRGIGKALLLRSLVTMREMGYAYAIIGWPARTAVPFYEKCVGAIMIEETTSGLYRDMIGMDE